MTYEDVILTLQARFPHPRYAFFREVGNAVGFHSSRIDALAMAMWRSLGLEVHGFEIKQSRGDWLREMKAPYKAEDLFSYCDRWWLVAGEPAIVKDGELPPDWGLLVVHGQSLRMEIKAKQLKPAALDREFVAAILRKAKGADKETVRHTARPYDAAGEIASATRSLSMTLSNFERRIERLPYAIQRAKRELGDGRPE